ncbi:hypothetical protein Ancab_020295 [Ancistrocladus abbreviatus]
MSTALHLMSNNIPGYSYGPSESGSLPCLGVSHGLVKVSHCTPRSDSLFKMKIMSLKCSSKQTSFVCKAGSSGQRRNPDFPRQNRHGFSRSRHRQNDERVNADNVEESEFLSSKNGPLLSLSNSSKFQATAAPGPREREIVELFRKVQAQLRERAAAKEEKKVEASKGQNKESETVDSLLKLLRKHSVEQGKRKVNGGSGSPEFNLEQPRESQPSDEDKSRSFLGSDIIPRDEPQEPNVPSFSRPPSNFRRRSPIPRVRYEPIVSVAETVNSISQPERDEKMTDPRPVPDSALEIEPESEPQMEPEPELVTDTIIMDGHVSGELLEVESLDAADFNDDEDTEEQPAEEMDLNSMKLSELRALAKARGVKGFSKMKKSELVGLLNEDSIGS